MNRSNLVIALYPAGLLSHALPESARLACTSHGLPRSTHGPSSVTATSQPNGSIFRVRKARFSNHGEQLLPIGDFEPYNSVPSNRMHVLRRTRNVGVNARAADHASHLIYRSSHVSRCQVIHRRVHRDPEAASQDFVNTVPINLSKYSYRIYSRRGERFKRRMLPDQCLHDIEAFRAHQFQTPLFPPGR